MDFSGIIGTASNASGKIGELAANLAGNKTSLIGIGLIAVLLVGTGLVVLKPTDFLGGQVSLKERVIKLAGKDVVIATGCNCPTDDSPVCGADGRTYWNACFASCLDKEVRSIGECTLSATPGSSQGAQGIVGQNPVSTATLIVNSVEEGSICGSTEQGGLNECVEGTQCIDNRCAGVDGVNCNGRIISVQEYNGDPSQCSGTSNCDEEINPVCAGGQITFSNQCEAENAGYSKSQIFSGACQIGLCPKANEPCGVTYATYNGEEKFTWHNAKACCSGLTCSNGICIGGNNYCPDGKRTTGSVESCYPTSTAFITASGETCPEAPVCPAASESCQQPVQNTCQTNETQAQSNANKTGTSTATTNKTTTANTTTANKTGTTNTTASKTTTTNATTASKTGISTTNISKTSSNVSTANAPSSGTVSTYCRDTDGGLNLSAKGTASESVNGVLRSGSDVCINGTAISESTIVREFYCSGEKGMVNSTFQCKSGFICQSGACVSTLSPTAAPSSVSSTCVDNDLPTSIGNGGNTSVGGSVSIIREGAETKHPDSCFNATIVNQSYCSGANVLFKTTTCPSDTTCTAGACVSSGGTVTIAPSCTDNDAPIRDSAGAVKFGGNVSVKGRATRTSGSTVIIKDDVCKDGKYVYQHYCGSSGLQNTTDACPAGTQCIGGACIAAVLQHYPTSVSSSFAVSPDYLVGEGSATSDATYSTIQYSTTTTHICPSGFNDVGNRCNIKVAEADLILRGWANADLTSDASAVSGFGKIQVKLRSASSGSNAVVLTKGTSGSWIYRGTCVASTAISQCNLTISPSTPVQFIFVGREEQTGNTADINLYWARVSN